MSPSAEQGAAQNAGQNAGQNAHGERARFTKLLPLFVVCFLTRFFGKNKSWAEGLGVWKFAVFAGLLVAGGLLWLLACLAFASIREQPGATEGGGNALSVALGQLRLLKSDAPFRRFVIARGLLLSVALAPPFYVLVAQSLSDAGPLGLGALIIANSDAFDERNLEKAGYAANPLDDDTLGATEGERREHVEHLAAFRHQSPWPKRKPEACPRSLSRR